MGNEPEPPSGDIGFITASEAPHYATNRIQLLRNRYRVGNAQMKSDAEKSGYDSWIFLGGSPRIYAREGALQRSDKGWILVTRFSAGDWKTQG